MSERDKFLTEAMGECWHEWENGYDPQSTAFSQRAYRCAKCKRRGNGHVHLDYLHDDFSTWEGKGKLWNWATQREWWLDFLWTVGASFATIPLRCVPPDGFANELHAYLKERK